MSSVNKDSNPLENLTEEQFAKLEESIKALDQDQKDWEIEKRNELKKGKSINNSLRRLKKTPLEIVNRILFLFFLGSFLFSFASIYLINHWWFSFYLISAFSCILYTPNRKALKELIAAWPNLEDLFKNRSLWKK